MEHTNVRHLSHSKTNQQATRQQPRGNGFLSECRKHLPLNLAYIRSYIKKLNDRTSEYKSYGVGVLHTKMMSMDSCTISITFSLVDE